MPDKLLSISPRGKNNGAWSTTINPGESVTIPKGYHNGEGRVSVNTNISYKEGIIKTYKKGYLQAIAADGPKGYLFSYASDGASYEGSYIRVADQTITAVTAGLFLIFIIENGVINGKLVNAHPGELLYYLISSGCGAAVFAL